MAPPPIMIVMNSDSCASSSSRSSSNVKHCGNGVIYMWPPRTQISLPIILYQQYQYQYQIIINAKIPRQREEHLLLCQEHSNKQQQIRTNIYDHTQWAQFSPLTTHHSPLQQHQPHFPTWPSNSSFLIPM